MRTLKVSVPFGDSLFLNKYCLPARIRSDRFRPLRGLSIPQLQRKMIGLMPKSFRPLRGLSIPQYVTARPFILHLAVSVPFGDSLFLNQEGRHFMKDAMIVSVPFGDSLFLNQEGRYFMKDAMIVSVPFGDSLFLNCKGNG